MLTDLNIKNIAIIDSLHVAFGDGLNVLTGETGAGKSIIVDAVELLLGGRASGDLIRSGAEEAVVEAVFDLSGEPELCARLAEAGIEADGELLVRRTIARNGKNRVFIGGGLATATLLSEIGSSLINIYGQHESQTLLRPENHLLLLDGFAGADQVRRELTALFTDYRKVQDALSALEQGERDRQHRIDLLAFQRDEIDGASLRPDEEEELEQERQLLGHAEQLFSASQGAYELIYGGEGSLLGQLRRSVSSIADLQAIDPSLAPVRDSLEDVYAGLEDAALTLRDYAGGIDPDPARLGQVEDRLDLIARLKRKYGATVPEVLSYRDAIAAELESLTSVAQSRAGLEEAVESFKDRIMKQGNRLTQLRRDGGERLSREMQRELTELSMPQALFTVSLDPWAEPRATGLERVEFLFSPNPGEAPRPLARIASGGELSRLMLALKQLHPESDVPTLVFDEVDTGIGGATSAMVGRKLRRVAEKQQVLCITHLPQVASCAHRHYRVEKHQESGRTVTSVSLLENGERVAEVARMLGGVTITDTTLGHARELIEEVQSHAS